MPMSEADRIRMLQQMMRQASPGETDYSQAGIESRMGELPAAPAREGSQQAFRAMEAESPSLFPSPDHNYQYNPYAQGAQYQPHPYTSGTEASINAPGPGDKTFWDRMARDVRKGPKPPQTL